MLNKIKKIRDKITPVKMATKKCENCKKLEYLEDQEFLYTTEICDCFLKILGREDREKVTSKIDHFEIGSLRKLVILQNGSFGSRSLRKYVTSKMTYFEN